MSSKLKLLVPAIAAGTVAVGGGAAYYFLKVQPAQDVANPLSSFEILPKETIAAGYFSFDEASWKKANRFGNAEARDLMIQQWEDFKTTLEENPPAGDEPLNFDADIKPWLGSVTFAGIQESEAEDPALLMVVGIKDKLEALKFANRQRDTAAEEVTVSTFEGVDIYKFSGGTPTFLAVLDNHLVVSDQKAQVESAIQVEKNGDSILQVAEIKQSLQESISVPNPVMVGFANPSSIIEQVQESVEDESFDPQLWEELKNYKAVSGAIGIENNGFRLKNVVKHTFDPEWQFDPLPNKVISRFPENTLALIHTGYVKQSWELIQAELEKDPAALQAVQEAFDNFEQETNINLTEDFLSWMDGEVGIGFIPADDGLLSQIGFGGAIAIETSDRSKAEGTLEKLNNFARGNGAEITTTDINGVSLTQWGIPLQSSLLSHGWLNESTVILAMGDSIATNMAQGSSSSVENNTIFQEATQTLGAKEQGLFFINAQELLNTVRNSPTMSSVLSASPDVDAVLSSIEGIAVSGSQPNQNTGIGEALMTFTQE